MTEGSSIEFLEYWMPQHEMAKQTYTQSINQLNCAGSFDILIGCLDVCI